MSELEFKCKQKLYLPYKTRKTVFLKDGYFFVLQVRASINSLQRAMADGHSIISIYYFHCQTSILMRYKPVLVDMGVSVCAPV